MAFTFAHPAAILPLRRYADPTALVIGSMIPDAGYFLGLTLPHYVTHGPVGMFLFCLPMGLLAYWLFRRFVQAPLAGLAPTWVQTRLPVASPMPSGSVAWGKVGIAVLVGAMTHAAWDDLTNRSRPLIGLIPWFGDQTSALIGPGTVRGYIFLDQLTSIVGTAIVVTWIGLWLWRAPPRPRRADLLSLRTRLIAITTLAFATVGVSLLLFAFGAASGDPKRAALEQLAAAVFPAATAAVLGYTLLWHLLGLGRRRSDCAEPRSER